MVSTGHTRPARLLGGAPPVIRRVRNCRRLTGKLPAHRRHHAPRNHRRIGQKVPAPESVPPVAPGNPAVCHYQDRPPEQSAASSSSHVVSGRARWGSGITAHFLIVRPQRSQTSSTTAELDTSSSMGPQQPNRCCCGCTARGLGARRSITRLGVIGGFGITGNRRPPAARGDPAFHLVFHERGVVPAMRTEMKLNRGLLGLHVRRGHLGQTLLLGSW